MELMGPISPKFPYPLDSRYYVDSSGSTVEKVLKDKAEDNTSYAYMKVVDKATGKTWELQEDGTWVLFTAKGDPGKSLEFKWDGTKLGIRQEGETDYKYSDLRGVSLEFKWDNINYKLGVRQEGQTDYTYSESLKGEDGHTPTVEELVSIIRTASFTQTGSIEDPNLYLYTNAKTIIAAINEINSKVTDILNGNS